MFCTQKELNELLHNYFETNKMIVFKVSNRCNLLCDHCREMAGPNHNDLLSDEIIDKVMSKIDSEWIVSIQGGEPSLFLDKSKYIINKCKEKSIKCVFYTNGWWGMDDELSEKIFNIECDFLVLSVNRWTLQQLKDGLKLYNHIAKSSINKKIKLIYSECYVDEPWVNRCLQYHPATVEYKIRACGRGSNISVKKDHFCNMSGYTIETDGTVWANCCYSINGCKFGTVDTFEYNAERKLHCCF